MLNMAIAMGNLAKPAQVRALPNGLMFAYFDLQVRTADQSLETVPVAMFDAPAQVPEWTTGQGLLAVGRVRRRFFRNGGVTQSRTELVADQVWPLTREEEILGALVCAGGVIATAVEAIRSAPPPISALARSTPVWSGASAIKKERAGCKAGPSGGHALRRAWP